MTRRLFAIAVAACLALAAASLAMPHAPAYDAWAWLVWGRELAGLDLDTSSGPSWKPLPVALTALLSPAGDAAPALWLVVVRASWLLGLVLAGAVAFRLTAGLPRRLRLVAAGFAALCLAVLFDEITAWARQAAIGMSEPLLVALVLGAVLAALDGRSRAALALVGLAALVRPEVWPLAIVYGVWRWRVEPGLRPWIAAVAVAVPTLWIVPDVLSSHGASSGGERALSGDGTPLQATGEVLRRAATMPLAIAWPLAAFAVVAAWRGASAATRARSSAAPSSEGPSSEGPSSEGSASEGSGGKRPYGGRLPPHPLDGSGRLPPHPLDGSGRLPPHPLDRAVLVLAAGAIAWIALVAVMAAGGFAGLPRFMAPAIAVVGVLGGVGLARLLARARSRAAAAAIVLLVLALSAQLPARAADVADAIDTAQRRAAREARLHDLVTEIGREPLTRCGKLATSHVLVRTALAWQLGVPLSEVVSFGAPPTRSGVFVVGPGVTRAARARLRSQAELIGRRPDWEIYSLRCSPRADASSSRSVGVSGARR